MHCFQNNSHCFIAPPREQKKADNEKNMRFFENTNKFMFNPKQILFTYLLFTLFMGMSLKNINQSVLFLFALSKY